ncbi:MAG: DUF4212 domain-containing protein [Alphaproteobacteria bacterium]
MSENTTNKGDRYWQANLRLLVGCIVVWFIVSIGFGIIFKDILDNIRIGGAGLGFWFAQQGAIYSFLLIIIFYAWRMGKIEKEFHVEEQEYHIPDDEFENAKE